MRMIYAVIASALYLTTKFIFAVNLLVPSPFEDTDACNRQSLNSSAICDPDNILSTKIKDTIDGHLNFIHTAEGAVCIIDRINPILYESRDDSLEDYVEYFAKKLHDDWNVGDNESSNGFLIFISILDRKIFISVGSGLVKMLSDIVLDSIISNVKPFFREKKYGEGIIHSIIEIGLALSEKDNTEYTDRQRDLLKSLKDTSGHGGYNDDGTHDSGGNWGKNIGGIISAIFFGSDALLNRFYRKSIDDGEAALAIFIHDANRSFCYNDVTPLFSIMNFLYRAFSSDASTLGIDYKSPSYSVADYIPSLCPLCDSVPRIYSEDI